MNHTDTAHRELVSSVARPRITVTQSDYARLSRFIENAAESAAVDYLAEELTRAHIVADEEIAHDVVRMGSRVTYRDGANGRTREITLVYPQEADISANRISVLTPIGAALIGMGPGQSIEWPAPDGGHGVLTVLSVSNEERAVS